MSERQISSLGAWRPGNAIQRCCRLVDKDRHTLSTAHSPRSPTARRAILRRLAVGGERTCRTLQTELAGDFQALGVLEGAGLIAQGRDEQRHARRLLFQPLEDDTAWLRGY